MGREGGRTGGRNKIPTEKERPGETKRDVDVATGTKGRREHGRSQLTELL